VLLSLNDIFVRIQIIVMGSVIMIDYNHYYFDYDIDLHVIIGCIILITIIYSDNNFILFVLV
jgi:hypothetical protein